MRISTLALVSVSSLVAVLGSGCGNKNSSQSNVKSDYNKNGSVSLDGSYVYSVSGSSPTCYGSLSLPRYFANSGIKEGANNGADILKIESLIGNDIVSLSYDSRPAGSLVNESFQVGTTKKEGTLVKRTVSWNKGVFQVKIEGADSQSLILSQKRVWEFSKLENGDLKIDYSGRTNLVFQDDKKSCILKKVAEAPVAEPSQPEAKPAAEIVQ